MKKLALQSVKILTALCLCGCANFSGTQDEIAPDGTRRHTSFRGMNFFDSKSDMTKVRLTTTDKSQTQSIGALNQEANGSNATAVLRIIVEGAGKATVP